LQGRIYGQLWLPIVFLGLFLQLIYEQFVWFEPFLIFDFERKYEAQENPI
jgi:hypothetical protein